MPPRTRTRIVAHGQVQGVSFRETAWRLALAAGVDGWVRNLPDGTVEAVFEGSPVAVAEMVAGCRTGPPSARVDRIEVSHEQPRGLRGFTIRPTPTGT